MSARQKPIIASAKYPSLKAVFGHKLKSKGEPSKLQSIKVTNDKIVQNTLQRKSSTSRIDERAFKEMAKNKTRVHGLGTKEAGDYKPKDQTGRMQKKKQSVEKSFTITPQNARPTITTQKEDKDGAKILQKQSPKIRKLISQGLVPKNLITKQAQQNGLNNQGGLQRATANPRITYRRMGNGNPNSQNINTINLNNNPTKGRNEVRKGSKNSNKKNTKSNNNNSTFAIEKDGSSLTLLKSQKAKMKVTRQEPKCNQTSSFINKRLNIGPVKKPKQKLIESFDNDLEESFEIDNLNCNEAMVKNKYNLKTDIGDCESDEDIEIEDEEDENDETARFEHGVFENLYDEETIDFMIEQEKTYAIKADYLDKNQRNINWTMRAILLDWIQEVCSDYLFKRETFHYAINYVDRYLTLVSHIEVKNLQLIGLGALFLAAKMEEVYTPKIDNIITAANNSYSQSQVRHTEAKIYRVI